MSAKMPIKLASGTTIGPVTIVCTTVTFLAMIACFVVLALYGDPNSIYKFLGPLIPVLATVGSALLLWVKTHSVQVTTTQQTATAAANASTAAEVAQHVEKTITDVGQQVTANGDKLNGELDAKILNGILTALQDDQFKTAVRAAVAEPPPAPTPPVKKAAAKRATRSTRKGT